MNPDDLHEFAQALFDDAPTPLTGQGPAGWGLVDGRDVCLAVAGAASEMRVRALAARTGRPLVTVFAGADADHDGGAADLRVLGALVRDGAALSGVVPQIAVVLTAADREAALLLPLADLAVAVRGARSALADPAAAETVTGAARSAGELGGADVHEEVTGRFAHVAEDAAEAARFVRDVLAHLPSNNRATAPRLPDAGPDPAEDDPELAGLLPTGPGAPYDVREVVARLTDDDLVELHTAHAPHVVTAFARIDGWSTGVVATQPAVRGGALDAAAAGKAARFVRWCDAFGVPVLTLVDTAGAVPAGEDDEGAPTVALARLLYAYAEATVGLLTVLTGRAHGPARLALGSGHVGADLVLAWPRARIGERDEFAAAARASAADDWRALVREAAAAAEPVEAVCRGDVDAVVDPGTTRTHLAAALRLLQRKAGQQPARRHGNVPL
ncbi:carboxyl transferase domain-containing protein [Kineococcus arenarius]|uniref:carboxyl transferase domain-containing protein n=1 Tax=unclassified Kineococcus TaxID=2621656 RepID=UPI003D7D3BA6